jgi:hypothetical protein
MWRRQRARRIRYARSAVGDIQRIGLRLGSREIGKILYQTCPDCRIGLVGKISIEPQWQGAGIGRDAIQCVVAAHPGLVWYTTIQMPGSEHFWTQMATDTGSPFTFSTGCDHLRHDRDLTVGDWTPDRLDL